jgi:hypothetical protein
MAISISFDRKDKNLTHWITLTYINTDPSPQTIIDALREAGWETARDRGLSDIPEIDGELTVSLSRRGSGLFTSWLPDEKKQFLSEARAILRRFGFTRVPINEWSWEDLQ